MTVLAETVNTGTPWRTKKFAAAYLDRTERTIDRMVADGTLKAYRLPPRGIRFRIEDLDALLVPIAAGLERA